MAVQQLGNDRTAVFTDGLDLVFERVFDAPRDLVWTVLTSSKHIPSWWGPHGTTTTVVEMDVRPGGTWHFISHAPDRPDVGFRGEFLEVTPPEGLRRTFIVVDIPGMAEHPGIETMALEDLGGRTRLTERSRFTSQEELETQLAVGMVGGALEMYDRLAEAIAAA